MSREMYTLMEMDALKEVANVGGGNAATAISILVSKTIHMDVPQLEILNYDEVYKDIMGEDEMVMAGAMRIMGDGEGSFLFVVKCEDAHKIFEMMMNGDYEMTPELTYSAFSEFVNILGSSYLNAVARLLDVTLISSVPAVTEDMFGAVLSTSYIMSEQYDEHVMIIKNEFTFNNLKIDSSLYFIPRPGVLDQLIQKIGL